MKHASGGRRRGGGGTGTVIGCGDMEIITGMPDLVWGQRCRHVDWRRGNQREQEGGWGGRGKKSILFSPVGWKAGIQGKLLATAKHAVADNGW